ncbi:MAG: hypothetical protein JW912_02225, partial [Sedimentisphaerales bacterium]|nr:hypothetical protein [Sedimentisphaerales bacterium]
QAEPTAVLEIDPLKEKRFNICIAILILAFGLYEAILLFGAYPVPNPDYPGFINVGKQLLHFQLPGSYKRAPVLGIMQVFLGRFMGGVHPLLTASWVLNDIFGMFNILLFWLVGRKLIGKAAIWLAFVAMLNPLVVRLQLVPIAETAIIFFTLITFYFIFKHSGWAYVFASIASMVRYEGSALIFIAFLMDVVTKKNFKDSAKSFMYAAIASIPLILWLLGTILNWDTQGGSHYFRNYKGGISEKVGFGFVPYIVNSTFLPLLKLPDTVRASFEGYRTQQEAVAAGQAANLFYLIYKILVALGCLTALLGAIIKRNWKLLALILFVILYSTAHGLRRATQARYTVPIMWLSLLIFCCGLQYLWAMINWKKWMPKILITTLQAAVIIIFLVWVFRLVPYLPRSVPACIKAASLPYVMLGAILLIILLRICFFKFRYFKADLALTAVVCAVLVSQHYSVVQQVGNGTYNIEFKILADWFIENSKPDEKLASTWTHILKVIASKHESRFVSLTICGADTFEEITERCYDEGLTYVTWTNRGSMATRRNVMALHEFLGKTEDHYPYKFMGQIKLGKRWINIFRLLPRSQPPDKNDTN